MSTSPSWFDQEKFSRLVKKVGPKAVTEPLPNPLAPINRAEAESRPAENPASTSRISLVSKPPSLLSDNRTLPTLPRRATPLPSLKPIFSYSSPAAPTTIEVPEVSAAKSIDREEPETIQIPSDEESALAETWQKMSLLNEELARAIHERDDAINESHKLRDQLREVKEESEQNAVLPEESPAKDESSEALARVTTERDDALLELKFLREQVAKKQEEAKELRTPSQTQELSLLVEERDQARKQYTTIRHQYEELKKDQSGPKEQGFKTKTGSLQLDTSKLIEDFRLKLAEREKEIAELKEKLADVPIAPPPVEDETAKQEAKVLREQLARAKDEASVAQRGLALSQKALHDTRDALREATEGTSVSRHNFDNLKNECATLSQQNAILQAKNEQLSKDAAAAKNKVTGRI